MGTVAKKNRVRGMRQHPPSPADEADARALDMAVESMIQHPLSGWDHTRPLGSLNRADLRNIAVAAISGWICERARQAKCGSEDAKRDQISAVDIAESI